MEDTKKWTTPKFQTQNDLYDPTDLEEREMLQSAANVLMKDSLLAMHAISSGEFRIKELEVEQDVAENDLRVHAWRKFADEIRKKLSADSGNRTIESNDNNLERTITFLSRGSNTKTRLILNQKDLLSSLDRYRPFKLQVYDFEEISFDEQLHVIQNTDVFIGMHGAGIAHVVYMRPGTTLIEMFPFGFQKRIYENLAKYVNVRYLSWRNFNVSNSQFHWDYVEANRLTDRPKELIVDQPVDWFNMDSKNYWRNQDTIVDLNTFGRVFEFAMDLIKPAYLLFMPWEQLGAQLDGFISACAIAHLTDYYGKLLHLAFENAEDLQYDSPFDATAVLNRFQNDTSEAIALGSAHQLYEFGFQRDYPSGGLFNHELSTLYKDIINCLFPMTQLRRMAPNPAEVPESISDVRDGRPKYVRGDEPTTKLE
ncbi:hypothetical protein HK102_012232 [Quaeritorhiza haematococci]|nr:hypothetical protein HK102_012232 [Quaeritorhiza haematococci]